jgi:hypothetical protein
MALLGAWTQTVTIDGHSARVRDLAISEAADSRIANIRFTLEALPDNQAAFDAAVAGAPVTITQSADGQTITNEAEIRRYEDERGRNWTQKRVEARGAEIKAQGVRFQDQWEATAASTVVTEAWNTYGSSLGYTLDIDTNSTPISIASNFDSLFDLMDAICRQVNWAWRIESGAVRFFDPLAETSPAVSQGDQQIEGGTLRVERSAQQLMNRARIQGYIYRTRRITIQVGVLQCRYAAPAESIIPPEDSQWEVVGEPRIVRDYKDIDRSVKLRYDDWLEFSPGIDPSADDPDANLKEPAPGETGPFGFLAYAEVVVEIRQRRKCWFIKNEKTSQAQFGTREGQPLSDDGGQGEPQCNKILSEHLARWAYPTINAQFSALEFGARHDSLLPLTLTDPALSGSLYVTEVRRTVRGPELDVHVTLASPQTVLD